MRAASLQGVADASADILLTTASDSALSRIRQVGNRDLALLTEAEAYRYSTLMRQVLLTMQNVFFRNELEVLDPRVWSGYRRVICDMAENGGFKATWHLHRHVLDEDFAALVESCPLS